MTARLMVHNGPNLNLLGIRISTAQRRSTPSRRVARTLQNLPAPSFLFINPTTRACWSISSKPPRQEADAIIINPAAYSFTSIAMLDAFTIFEGPIFEVHVSNIHARDELHRHSKLSSAVKAVIAGLGPYGYIVAMQAALHALGKMPQSFPAPLREVPR
jgi:3-dehydroquinate dehydratase-2